MPIAQHGKIRPMKKWVGGGGSLLQPLLIFSRFAFLLFIFGGLVFSVIFFIGIIYIP